MKFWILRMLQKMNLTAVTDVNKVMGRHIEDSLAILPPLHDSYISHYNALSNLFMLGPVPGFLDWFWLLLVLVSPFLFVFLFPLVVCTGLCFMWCHWYCTLLVAWNVTLFGVDEHALHYLGTCSLCYWFVKCWSMSGRAEVLFVAFWFWILIRLTVRIITFLV